MFFFLFVGGLVGTTFTLPFVETLAHRPFGFPESLLMMLLGYVLLGMPIAGLTGLLYGVWLAACHDSPKGRYVKAAGCGILPPLLLAIFGLVWNPRTPAVSLFVVACLMLFTAGSSLITAWIHSKTERRFAFFRLAEPNYAEADL